MGQDFCYTKSDVMYLLSSLDAGSQYETFKKIQIYVVVTILVLLLQLGYLIKPFAYGFFRFMSWVSYLLVPALISYIFGLMGQQGHTSVSGRNNFIFQQYSIESLRFQACVWSTFLLFAYAGFDNLNAFSLEERYGRSKLLVQIGIQFWLLLFIMYQLHPSINSIALLVAFIILAIKFVGRLVALAHSAGATPRIKNEVTRIIDYMNNQEDVDDDATPTDLVTTAGFGYLVGPKYTKIEGERIVEGITMGKIWGSQGRLMGSSSEHNIELKDTCMSFALFWLLLGKFLGYTLYDDNIKSSPSFRGKAWRLVRHGLLAEKGDHERVFRVIEIELAFMRDYFHARYIFFYLNGFYWKVISVLALPFMFLWFTRKTVRDQDLLYGKILGISSYAGSANTIVITVVVALEVIQVVVFLFSRWLKVTFLCFYVKKMASKNTGCLSRFFLEILGSVFLGSARSSNSSWWRKPWKKELDQFSLVQSVTTFPKPTSYLTLQFISFIGLPFSKPGWKHGKKVALSGQVKEAVVLCLQLNDVCPKLRNGAESLRRNRVIENLPNWACNLKTDAETILVWHIATSVCELHPTSPQSSSNMEVAIELSKYCAYLLFFAPSLLHDLPLVVEKICDDVIKETMVLFKKPFFSCGKAQNEIKYEKLMGLISFVDVEAEHNERGKSLLQKGVKIGRDLLTHVEDVEKRWKILAEFWAEMILYLAPTNNNGLAHAEKLSHGGEFITQLWALLIHSGIYDRDDMATAAQQPNTY